MFAHSLEAFVTGEGLAMDRFMAGGNSPLQFAAFYVALSQELSLGWRLLWSPKLTLTSIKTHRRAGTTLGGKPRCAVRLPLWKLGMAPGVCNPRSLVKWEAGTRASVGAHGLARLLGAPLYKE